MLRWLLTICWLLMSVGLYAQVQAVIKPTTILIGDRVTLDIRTSDDVVIDRLDATYLALKEELVVVSPTRLDQLTADSLPIVFTVFEAGSYSIPPIEVYVQGRQSAYATAPVHLQVNTIAADNNGPDLRPIKDITTESTDGLKRWWWVLPVTGLLLLGFWRGYRRSESVAAKVQQASPEEALREQLSQLPQKGIAAPLASALRTYISRRYDPRLATYDTRKLLSHWEEGQLPGLKQLRLLLSRTDAAIYARRKIQADERPILMAAAKTFLAAQLPSDMQLPKHNSLPNELLLSVLLQWVSGEAWHWHCPWAWLLLLPIFWWVMYGHRRPTAALPLPALHQRDMPGSWRTHWRPWLPWLQVAAVTLLVIALARPRQVQASDPDEVAGIDIVVVLDVSGSMTKGDIRFPPTRLTVARRIANDFIQARPYDRIGLVFFSDHAVTVAPLTTDHEVIQHLLFQADSISLGSGTAIGLGLATAVNRLEKSDASTKVAVLLTDGRDNGKFPEPLAAGQLAAALGIRTYLVGIRTSTVDRSSSVDEQVLQQIAALTGGQYFAADNEAALATIFEEIDRLETTLFDTDVPHRYRELYFPFAVAAFILLSLDVLLRSIWLRALP